MQLSPQTDQSLRSLAILGLRHLRRFQIFDYEPRAISNDDLEEIGRRAAAAVEAYLSENPQPNARASLGRRGQDAGGFTVPTREVDTIKKSR